MRVKLVQRLRGGKTVGQEEEAGAPVVTPVVSEPEVEFVTREEGGVVTPARMTEKTQYDVRNKKLIEKAKRLLAKWGLEENESMTRE